MERTTKSSSSAARRAALAWRVGLAAGVLGAVALVAAACSGAPPVSTGEAGSAGVVGPEAATPEPPGETVSLEHPAIIEVVESLGPAVIPPGVSAMNSDCLESPPADVVSVPYPPDAFPPELAPLWEYLGGEHKGQRPRAIGLVMYVVDQLIFVYNEQPDDLCIDIETHLKNAGITYSLIEVRSEEYYSSFENEYDTFVNLLSTEFKGNSTDMVYQVKLYDHNIREDLFYTTSPASEFLPEGIKPIRMYVSSYVDIPYAMADLMAGGVFTIFEDDIIGPDHYVLELENLFSAPVTD